MRGPDDRVRLEGDVVTRLTLAPDADGKVTLDGPRVEALARRLAEISPRCRVVVLSSAADELCSGLDLAFAVAQDTAGRRASTDALRACLAQLIALPQPVVVVADGPTIGGGVALLGCADLVLASERATFQLPELCLGLTPAFVAATALRRVHASVLRRWTLTGASIDAAEARAAGLVDRVVPRERLEAELDALVRYLLRARPAAIAAFKADLEAARPDARAALEAASRRTAGALEDPELEGELRRFLEGEAPSWFSRPEPT